MLCLNRPENNLNLCPEMPLELLRSISKNCQNELPELLWKCSAIALKTARGLPKMIWKEEEEAEEKSFEKKTTICSEVHTILHKNYSEIALRERERVRERERERERSVMQTVHYLNYFRTAMCSGTAHKRLKKEKKRKRKAETTAKLLLSSVQITSKTRQPVKSLFKG